jgi:hypothetical protein
MGVMKRVMAERKARFTLKSYQADVRLPGHVLDRLAATQLQGVAPAAVPVTSAPVA